MSIDFTEQDHDNIAKLFDYSDMSEEDMRKADDKFKMLLECNEAPRYLYVIRCFPHSYYKIGITNDLGKRLRDHQTGCPFELRMIFAVEADMADFLGREIAYLESFFHNNYEKKNVRGEWFELTDEEISEMCIFLQNDREFDILHSEPDELEAFLRANEEALLDEEE
ncbi:GIY-YIG nuclease family protein [Geobacter sp. AOG1]|uniref:GIY-YIG nuclease family protein n=1 Tax=Geobacter sp. AOG1 TaxID=1566346 RepID=UPI001CC421A4|nr:GIY-YIG nuclease family protein [Geobacter sp. AOG1]GFE58823.1 hypothetical protein AOG1_27030 [Geobacter sp. AOG1]